MCYGDTAQICAPAGLTSYTWNTGDTTTCINTPNEGNYHVTVSENGNCSATSNQINISIYPQTPVTVSVSGDTLTAYSANSYQWFLNGLPITGATSSIYIAQSSGIYTLQITDTNGCIATSSPILITGITEELSEDSITISPNPSTGNWQLKVSAALIGRYLCSYLMPQAKLYFNPKSAAPNPKSPSPTLPAGFTSCALARAIIMW